MLLQKRSDRHVRREHEPGGREVGRISLSGAGDEERVGIFWSCGTTIRACNRKGKEHLKFNTNLAEPIRSLHVEAEEIYAGGEYIFSQFTNCKDSAFFMAGDRINDLATEKISGAPKPDAVLGCQDRYVRVLDVNKLHYEAFVQGAVQSLSRFSDVKYSDVLKQVKEVPVIFGTDNGLLFKEISSKTLYKSRGYKDSKILLR